MVLWPAAVSCLLVATNNWNGYFGLLSSTLLSCYYLIISYHVLSYPTVCCYLVWLTWCTVTSTPDTETARDPTDEYFNDRGIQVGSTTTNLLPILS